jgi:hypothetical protein
MPGGGGRVTAVGVFPGRGPYRPWDAAESATQDGVQMLTLNGDSGLSGRPLEGVEN